MTEPGWKMFDITLADLQKGEHRILDRDPFILNPHPQFEPGEVRMFRSPDMACSGCDRFGGLNGQAEA